MVTYYNRGDLSSFGNYLFSEERKNLIHNHPETNDGNLDERLSNVTHADVENWKEIEEKKKRKG